MEIMLDYDPKQYDDIVKALDELPREVTTRMTVDGEVAAAKVIAEEARVIVPRRSGDLQRSIKVRRGNDRRSTAVVAGGSAVPYALRVELGSPNRPAKPFMVPALMRTSSKLLSAAADGMRRSFARIVRAARRRAGTTG